MKPQAIMQSPVAKKLYEHKFNYTTQMLLGNVRGAKKVYREYAKLAIDNFELACDVPSPVKGSISLFSKTGFNIFKYMFCNMFMRDSSEEKQLKKMAQEYKIKKDHLKAY